MACSSESKKRIEWKHVTHEKKVKMEICNQSREDNSMDNANMLLVVSLHSINVFHLFLQHFGLLLFEDERGSIFSRSLPSYSAVGQSISKWRSNFCLFLSGLEASPNRRFHPDPRANHQLCVIFITVVLIILNMIGIVVCQIREVEPGVMGVHRALASINAGFTTVHINIGINASWDLTALRDMPNEYRRMNLKICKRNEFDAQIWKCLKMSLLDKILCTSLKFNFTSGKFNSLQEFSWKSI